MIRRVGKGADEVRQGDTCNTRFDKNTRRKNRRERTNATKNLWAKEGEGVRGGGVEKFGREVPIQLGLK